MIFHRKPVGPMSFVKPKFLQENLSKTLVSWLPWNTTSNTRIMSSVETEEKLHYMWTVSEEIAENED